MNCSDVRHLIHLDVGGDLVTEEENAVAAHMERCGDCRTYHSGMLKAMMALQSLRSFDPPVGGVGKGSSAVWQAVAAKLPAKSWRPAVQKQFNMRVVALCVCSVALAVVSIVQSLPVANISQPGDSGMPASFASGQFGSAEPFGTARGTFALESGVPQNSRITPKQSDYLLSEPAQNEPNSF